ncbi:GNAT family N-acetyltransferase [Pseudalkalibacillus caeni]|uniref:GNAT family N-acetyltransferase n=1 Tax=Exobacillus caeni TaxID=2574798 RepID=A0A5R9EYP1_9BACL|nr:GNAT family protein [Pseudalkalibacillus caeni]TLS36422.1 GNAT family N-acetyltransferase [Pseudalkalibacillus caeni]
MKIINSDKKKQISLCDYKTEHYAALEAFFLPEEQKQYTAMPAAALEKCLTDPDRHPIVILAGEIPVGFFVLHSGEAIKSFSDNPKAILIRALSIDISNQGKGYGKLAMMMAPEFVSRNFNGIDEIVLAVNKRNIAAKKLYEKAGFQFEGTMREGRIGPQYILHYRLNT